MRKDIFLTGVRLLGLWQLCGATISLAYLLSEYIGYIRPQPNTHEYNLIRFGAEFFVGLFFVFRPHNIFHFVQRLSVEDDEEQADNGDADNDEPETR